MVLRLRQHNIGYTAGGFYRSDDPTNSVKVDGQRSEVDVRTSAILSAVVV